MSQLEESEALLEKLKNREHALYWAFTRQVRGKPVPALLTRKIHALESQIKFLKTPARRVVLTNGYSFFILDGDKLYKLYANAIEHVTKYLSSFDCKRSEGCYCKGKHNYFSNKYEGTYELFTAREPVVIKACLETFDQWLEDQINADIN